MRNFGLFSPAAISIKDLVELGSSLGGQPIGDGTLRFGEIPNEAYLDLSVDLANGCFDDEEFAQLQQQLGFTPASYVSVHLNYSHAAQDRALGIVNEMQRRWGGKVDYSGVTGDVDHPFEPGGPQVH